MTKHFPVHFDGLVGPTHHYAGLSFGNLASMANKKQRSYPKAAALQGLEKMRFMRELGVKQAFLPPPLRPRLDVLEQIGLKELQDNTLLLSQIYSAASMWAANCATASPSHHCLDGRVHFTPANRITLFHRSLEAQETFVLFNKIFKNERFFQVHEPLPAHLQFADEGAANHLTLKESEIFVYGSKRARYPVRQTLAACEAIARLHQLKKMFYFEQHPKAIDAGVFHNDVIAFADEGLVVVHEGAYLRQKQLLKQLEHEVKVCVVMEKEMSLEAAVESYFFNSHSLCLNGKRTLVAPLECQKNKEVCRYIEKLSCFDKICFVDLEQSMKNGGGPACLTLAVPMTQEEWAAVDDGVKLDDKKYFLLKEWIERYYRESLTLEELASPLLAQEARAANTALEEIMSKR